MVCFCSALLSASIELSQAWIPTRDSNLLGFLLNISGALAGAGLHVVIASRDRAQQTGNVR
jgi:VanZ family protein